ncbi:unnamed protein product [Onchocerca flexuosa]|uniref:Uncharacterized protein n=1 Tax=Onchocerca flexuosa TaxID=387005 RepID=A0A183H022_9BILA|nr:unnamed protein product [Onchocerca flexuosa]
MIYGKEEIGSYQIIVATALITEIIHLFKFFRSFYLEKLHLYGPIVISVCDLFRVKA